TTPLHILIRNSSTGATTASSSVQTPPQNRNTGATATLTRITVHVRTTLVRMASTPKMLYCITVTAQPTAIVLRWSSITRMEQVSATFAMAKTATPPYGGMMATKVFTWLSSTHATHCSASC